MSTLPRSFTVFMDTPPADPIKPRAAHSDAAQPENHGALSVTDLLSPAHAAAKENLHPLTGESTTSSKKRKTSSVLATKVHNPPTSKKQKESASVVKPKTESKKRKAPVAGSSPLKAKKGAAPDKAVAAKKKPTTRAASKRKATVTPLPQLAEEGEAEVEVVEKMTQADVDSRCYELTVLPLADVTTAFDASPSMDYLPLADEPAKALPSRVLRAKSSEPDLRDYYTPTPSLSSSTSLSSSQSSKRCVSMPPILSNDDEDDAKTFSTPERKQIYAAFTFTSPSPTAARYGGLTRSASVDVLSFGDA
ncbi:hypothetical protein HWV62_38118 [Athelia sp. TMB]|nr:hypothetical protein HWV62_38118 [Athelia sp. TMB]